MMKTAISMSALLVAVLALMPVNLRSQTSGSPAEKDFVSGGKV